MQQPAATEEMDWLDRLIAWKMERVGALFDVTLFDLGSTHVTLATLTSVVLIFIVTLWVSRVLRAGVRRTLTGRQVDPRTVGVVTNILNYVVLLSGLGVALDTIGLDLAALFAAGAAFAVGIGLALQSVVQNFFSGVVLLVERSIKPLDVLELKGEMLRVQRIGIRSTVATTRDGEFLLIPNNELVQNTVRHLTFERDDAIRVVTSVGVHYRSDMRQVHEVLLEVATEHHEAATPEEARVFLTEFGDNTVNWDVTCWTQEAWSAASFRSELNRKIWDALDRAGIEIAYPQVDVHLDAEVVDALRRAAS